MRGTDFGVGSDESHFDGFMASGRKLEMVRESPSSSIMRVGREKISVDDCIKEIDDLL